LLSLFWLAESVRWILEISARGVITADYTIIKSRTLKVKGNRVVYDRGAWFLRVIMSSSRALCCSPSVKKQKHYFNFSVQCIIKQLLDLVFVISRIIEVSVRFISLGLRLRLITLTSTSIILDITKPSCNNRFIHRQNIISNKTQWVLCTTRSHGTELIMLGRKLPSGTSKTEELVPVQPDFPLFWNLLPSIINVVPYDRIVQRAI